MLRHLSVPHRVALAGATALSLIALNDAVTHGLTGHYSVFADDSGRPGFIAFGQLLHGMAYVGFAAVLVRERRRFAQANAVARATRWVVLVSLAALAVVFLVGPAAIVLGSAQSDVLEDALGGAAGVGFVGMLLGSLVLGLALRRSRTLGVGARVLQLMIPAAIFTALIAAIAVDWAHPAYVETVSGFGLALLGVGEGAGVRARKGAQAAAGTAPAEVA